MSEYNKYPQIFFIQKMGLFSLGGVNQEKCMELEITRVEILSIFSLSGETFLASLASYNMYL
jgi:hypothetical protein